MRGELEGREDELAALLERWDAAIRGRPQLLVVSGHRRVGKTFLLLHFLQRLTSGNTLYYPATQQAEAVELRQFARAVAQQLDETVIDAAGGRLANWESALRLLQARAKQSPLAVVLDEVPNLAESTPGFASIVQAFWDRASMEPTRLLLVLCGSAVSVMESMVSGKGALHRRESLHLRLRPFELPQAVSLLPGADPESAIEAYAACGGYPLHLRAWDTSATSEGNLEQLAGSPSGVMLEDAKAVLGDLPQGPGFGRVLAAVGRGRTRFSDIASDAGQRIEYPLDLLVQTGLLRREVPIGSPRRARPQYQLRDTYLRFWFQVLYSDVELVEGGQGHAVLRQARPRWREHVGWTFEEAARQHAIRLTQQGTLPGDAVVGRWWTVSGREVEIDVLGLSENHTVFAGEASWSSEPVTGRDVHILRDKLQVAPDPLPDVMLCFWRRGGLLEAAKTEGALHFGPHDVVLD